MTERTVRPVVTLSIDMAGRRSLSETHGNSYSNHHFTTERESDDANDSNLDTTFNHKTFESLDASIDQMT